MANVTHFNLDGQIIDIPIPSPVTVNNGMLTIQKNGADVQTFTANQSRNATANITVPTKVSELTNDSGYTTNKGTVTQVKVGTTEYNPSSGVVSLPAYPTMPTVNNGKLTIQKNGTNVATFTANQSGNATANITVPTVNNGTLTIQKNGTNVQTFTANQSGNATANITVPTKVSDLTQDNKWIKLGTASTSTAATFSNIANAGYHDMMIVVRLNAGADFRFAETFSVNTFDNGAILTRLGYMTNPTTDFNWVQVSLGATSMSIGGTWSAFTVTSCYADLYVKK